jgi:hypothetical protein
MTAAFTLRLGLEHKGEPETPADLAQNECLGLRTSKSDIWTPRRADETAEIVVGGRRPGSRALHSGPPEVDLSGSQAVTERVTAD